MSQHRGTRERLRDMRKGVKEGLKSLIRSDSRSRPESPMTLPSGSSTPRSGIDASDEIPTEVTSPSSRAHGSNDAGRPSASHASSAGLVPPLGTSIEAKQSLLDKTKDRAGVGWSFMQLLLSKAPDFVSMDPVTAAVGFAKVVLELSQGMQDNMDAVDLRIASTLSLLYAIENAVKDWNGTSPDETRAMNSFERTLREALNKLMNIKTQSKGRQFACQEEDKQRIVEIFDNVNKAREQLILTTGLRVHKITVTIDQKLNNMLRERLNPSHRADHKCYLEDEEGALLRAACTAGTRVRILYELTVWANDTSGGCRIYWLFGPAGTGKSTIACTIARRFEFACVPGDTIVLGANFFCSRQFDETKAVTQIVPTIVYQLARVCKAFADAYDQNGDDSTIQQNPAAQLRSLLVEPWKQSHAARVANRDPTYLVAIDALDELKNKGGSVFLRALLNIQSELSGLKFFVTSREDPNLVTYSNGMGDGQVCRLQEVPREEADADLRTYLLDQLGHVAREEEIQQLVTDAAGLFIYARTVVEYIGVASRPAAEQRDLLDRLLDTSPSTTATRSRSATATLDKLYLQILDAALRPNDPEQHLFQKRLHVFHAFLCTVERTSTSVVTHLLEGSSSNNPFTIMANTTHTTPHASVADDILGRLHAVLYIQGGQVMSFHKSFPDFVFDQERSKEFYCDQESHHRRLAEGCFRIMRQQLRFNIAGIPDSRILDQDNMTPRDSVKRSISLALSYACRCWSQHVIAAPVVDAVALSLHDFLQLEVLFWIETMNLLGQRGRCNRMLGEAQKCFASSKAFTNLAKHLRDAAAFAVYFSASPAASSTPHLYLSALATFPQRTALCATWRTHFAGIPAFTNAIRGGGSPLMSINVKSRVKAVAVSPDGFWVATGSDNGIVQVWDLSTGQELKTLEGHSNRVTSVAFSQDGTRIVSGSYDQTVRVWDASSGEESKILKGHSRWVTSVAFSQDGTRIVSGSYDQTVRVWDAANGEELKTFEGHSDDVKSVAFSRDGTWIVSGSGDQTVRVWDALTGEELKTLEGHIDAVSSVAFSQDGMRIVSGSWDQTVRLWDAASGEVLKTLEGHGNWVNSVAFSLDGMRIVSASHDQTVRVWDASSGEELQTLKGHSRQITSVCFLQDGTHIVSGSGDSTVQVWDAVSREELKSLDGHSGWVTTVALAQDGRYLVSGSNDQTVRVWDAASGEALKTLKGHCREITSVAFSQDGTQIVSGSRDKTVRVWGALTGETLKTLEGHSKYVRSVAFSPDGMRIVSGSHDQTVRVWDVLSGEELKILKGHSREITSVAFSQDGTQVVSGSRDQTVRVWDVLSGEVPKTLVGHSKDVNSVAFSQNGIWIVSGSDDQTVRVWDALSGEALMTMKGHSNDVISVGFSPDGMRIVSGSGDRTVRVWDASTGEGLKTLEGHSDWVRSVAFSPDGMRVISGSDDQTLRMWDASSGEELNKVDVHDDGFRSLNPPQDGMHVVSGTGTNTTQVGCLPTGTPIGPYTREKLPQVGYTGWLLTPGIPSAYLMFVPLSENILGDSILVLPRHAASYVDFSKAKLGTDWAQCYTPVGKN